ncbi:methyltransferase domain-containing protein [Ramlibacter tataouinensis]|uniref:methyltransferase domain-containing protein n=1 Tax=Ramlibacter tataouinensis TaxID=94132 RepID=UPI0022F3C611|nr:methyltransferase domain-containing protein [Ramlibacter tataouinensis]WBY01597.1 methyltransferase domain-containing protein [Ramlibacter tataouinensis]
MDDDFSLFHRYAKLDFALLAHEFQLPYEDERFDMVISGGVLEHVAFERESMMEVWRTLKGDGLFVITFLPNRGSISENLHRLLGHFGGHNRLYSLARAKESFLRRGFVLETAGYHQIFPTLGKNVRSQRAAMLIAGLGARLNRPLERVPGVRGIASNLYFVLRKAKYM